MTSSGDKTRLWDALTGEALRTFEGSGIAGASFSPDGRQLVMRGAGGTLRLVDADTAEEIAALMGQLEFTSATFSPDGRRIVTACADGTARLWDTSGAQQFSVLEGHRGKVMDPPSAPTDAGS